MKWMRRYNVFFEKTWAEYRLGGMPPRDFDCCMAACLIGGVPPGRSAAECRQTAYFPFSSMQFRRKGQAARKLAVYLVI